MTEKVKMVKQLEAYVEMYKKEEKFSNGEIRFCGLFNTGVHVGGVDNIFKIAKYLGVGVEITDRESEEYGKEISVMYEGVKFFAIGTEEELAEVNI